VLNLENSIFQPIKRHKLSLFGIMELTRNLIPREDLCHVHYITESG